MKIIGNMSGLTQQQLEESGIKDSERKTMTGNFTKPKNNYGKMIIYTY
jgi:hypothetical protein